MNSELLTREQIYELWADGGVEVVIDYYETRLREVEAELARQIELRIEDEPTSVRRQAERADKAEAENERLKKQLTDLVDWL